MNDSNKPEFGRQVKVLFDQCIDQPTEKINHILTSSEASFEVIERVKSLLNHSANDQLELTQAIIQETKTNQVIQPLQPQTQVFEFTLSEPLGQGGQGEVWKAHRTDGQFNQEVAIKFLKPIYTDKELSRFHNEREFLAALKHTNIAHLIGGGEYEKRPYMVMDWVDGQPLIEHCQQQKSSLKTRLDYFLQVCDAISHAHMNRVIHRDIKPSNVLITQDNVVKLLDFGIAKTFIKNQGIDQTETAISMTLAYSSPEQVTGEAVSTATDVYALGLFLYELLTGIRAQGHNSEIPAKVIKEITTQPPTLPSQTDQAALKSVDYQPGHLNGDLDNLIMKAISKEPSRRYDSTQALANDVRNYLKGLPLLATGDNWVYKTKKLIKRNPVGATLTFVALGLMIALPVILLYFQKQVQEQRDEAQKQATIAQRSNDFLTGLLRAASPLGANDGEILLKDVLKLGEIQIAEGLDDQPIIKAPLLVLLGDIHSNLQQFDKSIEYYKQAYDLYSQTNDVQGKINALSQLGFVLYEDSQLTESKKIMAQSNALFKSSQELNSSFQAMNLSRQATMLNYEGENEQAREVINQALEILKTHNIIDYDTLGRLYNELSISYNFVDNKLAIEHMRTAIKYGKLVNKNNPFSYLRQVSLAVKLNRIKQPIDALAVMAEAKQGIVKLYSDNHIHYATAVREEAYIHHDLGQYKEAESLYKKAMSIYKSSGSDHSLHYLLQLNNLAYLYEDMRNFEQAELLYRESLQKRRKYFASEPMRVASTAVNLARLLAKKNQFSEAATLQQEGMAIYTANKRSNIYNEVTQVAINMGDSNIENCQHSMKQIEDLQLKLEKESVTNWRRMQAELWLGQMAAKCKSNELSKSLMTAALNKSKNIYKPGSDGQRIVAEQVALALKLLPL